METLKVGITIIDSHVYSWQYDIIEKLVNSGYTELVIINTFTHSSLQSKEKKHYFYYLHEKLDRLYFKQKTHYLKRINIISHLSAIPEVTLKSIEIDLVINTFHSDHSYFNKLEQYKLDIILNFTTTNCDKYFNKCSKYGILSYKLDGENEEDEYPPCYWEMVYKYPKIEASCILIDNFGKKSFIARVSLSTYPNSIHINRNKILKLATLIIPRFIDELNILGTQFFERTYQNLDLEMVTFHNKKVKSGFPNSFTAIKNFTILLKRFLLRNILYKEIGRWSVLYKFNNSISPFDKKLDSFDILKSRKDTFIADPFIVNHEEEVYIILEEFDYKRSKGHISIVSIDSNGNQGEIRTIIERPYHMSYPFIFKLDEIYYLMPETSSNNSIELYKCLEFPYKWEFYMNLMKDVVAKDSTLFFFNQKWWLFTSISEVGMKDLNYNELNLFYTDNIFFNNWKSHPRNPIVTDPRLSRSAGKIFLNEGKIYRPSQDCSGTYGNAININQITELNENEYMEELISKIKPDWDNNLKGMHTLNFDKSITVIDVFQSRRKF